MVRYVLSLGLLCPGVIGCGASFDFVSPPVIYPSGDPIKRCVQRQQIVMAPARARWSTSKSTTSGKWIWTTTTRWSRPGKTFYRDRKRLSALDALAVVEDPHLERAYRAKVAGYASKRRSRRTIAAVLWTLGFSGLIAGTTVAFLGINTKEQGVISGKGKIMALAGAGGALLSGVGLILPGTFVLRSMAKYKRKEQIHSTILASPGLYPDFERAVARYNKRVLARCTASPR
jgi:hypothetical protein